MRHLTLESNSAAAKAQLEKRRFGTEVVGICDMNPTARHRLYHWVLSQLGNMNTFTCIYMLMPLTLGGLSNFGSVDDSLSNVSAWLLLCSNTFILARNNWAVSCCQIEGERHWPFLRWFDCEFISLCWIQPQQLFLHPIQLSYCLVWDKI